MKTSCWDLKQRKSKMGMHSHRKSLESLFSFYVESRDNVLSRHVKKGIDHLCKSTG